MSGPNRLIATVTGVTVDTTVGVPSGGNRAFKTANYWVQVTAIAGTWTMTARWKSDAGTHQTIATSAALTATGLVVMALHTAFSAAEDAKPIASNVLFDVAAGGGTLSADVYAMLGD